MTKKGITETTAYKYGIIPPEEANPLDVKHNIAEGIKGRNIDVYI